MKIMEINNSKLAEICHELIMWANVNSGCYMPQTEQIVLQVQTLVDLLKRNYPHFDLYEFKEAVKIGVFGRYGKVANCSPAVINIWLSEWGRSKEREIYLKKNSNVLPEKSDRPSDEELNKMKIQNIKDQYTAFIEGRPFVDGGNVTFKFLQEKGYIPEDLSRYDEQARLFAETVNQRHRRVKSVGEYVEMIQRTAENRRNYLAICDAFRGIQQLCGIETIELSNEV